MAARLSTVNAEISAIVPTLACSPCPAIPKGGLGVERVKGIEPSS
jgi:hypothetical protein